MLRLYNCRRVAVRDKEAALEEAQGQMRVTSYECSSAGVFFFLNMRRNSGVAGFNCTRDLTLDTLIRFMTPVRAAPVVERVTLLWSTSCLRVLSNDPVECPRLGRYQFTPSLCVLQDREWVYFALCPSLTGRAAVHVSATYPILRAVLLSRDQ